MFNNEAIPYIRRIFFVYEKTMTASRIIEIGKLCLERAV